ncbi:sugar phosphate isomerase/epimerase family protein [Formosa haliotis]|uniref:sugar phosphate isomerase/epimerase family protein n=1 Tax=Formosa haliotis TaxID=1555194 RepID=UPI000825E251|nr:TIM barrel protein [Formosa haliotis]
MKKIASLILILLFFSACKNSKQEKITNNHVFQKRNLIPWAIVGFDNKERNPKERIDMIKRLGFSGYGYGHRVKHIPSMQQEWELAQSENINIDAVWIYLNLDKDQPDTLRDQNEAVLKNLKLVGLKTQIWVAFDAKHFENLSDDEALADAVKMVSYLSERASKLGCKIALYNHGGWAGNSENQIKIIKALPNENIGIVFNFHHAHQDLDHYTEHIKMMLPYLWCVNLNGMKKDGPKIMTIGDGDLEKDMIQQLLDIGYKGPFGILGHVSDTDPEVILQDNVAGLWRLFPKDH